MKKRKSKMDTKLLFEEVSQCLAGSCQYGSDPMDALEDGAFNLIADEISKRGSHYREHDMDSLVAMYLELANVNEQELATHIENIEQFLCNDCGWWSYPGEESDDGVCSDCVSGE